MEIDMANSIDITMYVVRHGGEVVLVTDNIEEVHAVMAQCTPSRENLYTQGILVEEDNVFAPRKVEIECAYMM